MKFQFILFLISMSMVACIVPGQMKLLDSAEINNLEDLPPSKPGTCYGKCLIQDKYEAKSDYKAVFTGEVDDPNDMPKYTQVETAAATTKWVKKKADKNCKSENPEDCMVWCLVEVPAQYKTILDTSSTKNYEFRNVDRKQLVSQGGNMEWLEVVCEKDFTDELIADVQGFLISEGLYDIEGQTNKEDLLPALILYQEENGLPVGNYNLETLDAMGIGY